MRKGTPKMEFLLCWVIRLHRRLDHAERELDIALQDGRKK